MENALQLANVEVPVVCDVYQPNLEKAVAISGRGRDGTPDARSRAKGITDFRDILRDKVHRCREHLDARSLARLHDR